MEDDHNKSLEGDRLPVPRVTSYSLFRDMCEGRSGKRRSECADEEMTKMKKKFEETETAPCTLHYKYEEQ